MKVLLYTLNVDVVWFPTLQLVSLLRSYYTRGFAEGLQFFASTAGAGLQGLQKQSGLQVQFTWQWCAMCNIASFTAS